MLYESQYYGVSYLGGSLSHHGIKGQKWGIRRYQNPDGSLTSEGRARYGTAENFNRARQDRNGRLKTAAKVAATAAAVGIGAYAVSKIGSSRTQQGLRAIKSLSDDELVSMIGRLEKEKKLIDLNRELTESGRSTAEKVIRQAGKATVSTIATSAGIFGGKKLINKTAEIMGKDGDKVERQMFPKKK